MIPVFDPQIDEDDIQEVVKALRAGEISGSFGKYIPEFEAKFAKYSDCKFGVAVTSGTTALHLAIASLELSPGDEVLISASTNIATALAIYHNGATPIPIDSEEKTWNLNPELLQKKITKKTKAILPVHLFGHPANMNQINKIAQAHNLKVIEDCAESHGATYYGKKTGSLGDAGCFSFYANKVITTGEGGMITTNDEKLAAKMKYLRNLAFGQPRFLHQEAGFNFRMTGYQAAMGLSQTNKIESIIAKKRQVAHSYLKYLGRLTEYIDLPVENENCRNVYWMFGIVLKDNLNITKEKFMEELQKSGIETRSFFCPMNLQPFLREKFQHLFDATPVAERIWKRGCYLPSGPNLSDNQIELISQQISMILERSIS